MTPNCFFDCVSCVSFIFYDERAATATITWSLFKLNDIENSLIKMMWMKEFLFIEFNRIEN